MTSNKMSVCLKVLTAERRRTPHRVGKMTLVWPAASRVKSSTDIMEILSPATFKSQKRRAVRLQKAFNDVVPPTEDRSTDARGVSPKNTRSEQPCTCSNDDATGSMTG